MNYDDIAERFGASNGTARCPAHNDRTPSLSVNPGEDGKTVIYCHAGCATEDVVDAVGLTMADLRGDETPTSGAASSRGRRVAEYTYRDHQGTATFRVVRSEPKSFHVERAGADGQWRRGQGKAPRVMYRLPAVLAAIVAGDDVWVVEGEKDAEALVAAGVCATTWPGGALKSATPAAKKFGQHVDDIGLSTYPNVVVVEDRDAAGREHTKVLWLKLPSAQRFVIAATGKDAAEHLAAGLDVADFIDINGHTGAPITAGASPPPPPLPPEAFFEKNRLLVDTLFEAIVAETPLAAAPGGEVWVYGDGTFRRDRRDLTYLVTRRLRDRYQPMHLANVRSYAEAELAHNGFDLTAAPSQRLLVNMTNGMLDPFDGSLLDHDSKYLSTSQLPVAYDPAARAPRFGAWLAEVVPDADRRATLLEDLGAVLDLRGRRQKKAVFLIGPTRSGKSTMARIIEAVVGAGNRSTEELLDLASNRFRAAQLFGKVLNVASDISAGVTDVGVFKKLTGEDTITGEHKFGHPFSFRFHGLMLMTMNGAPTVSDASGAYLARVRPYHFGVSFIGREDPNIEAAIIELELPGVLNLLVAGLQRIEARNGYHVDDTTRAAEEWFARQSDRVRLFLAERTFVAESSWTKRGHIHDAYADWAKDARRGSMSRTALYEALRGAGVVELRHQGVDGFRLSLVADPDLHFEGDA